MRLINEIIIHCSDTPEGRDTSLEEIRSWHIARGFSDIGYHYVIHIDGSVGVGRSLDKIGAHCYGHNRNSVGICYIGGRTKDNKSIKDTRTLEQIESLKSLVNSLKTCLPTINKVSGHYEYSTKTCPNFDVKKEFN